MNNHHCDRGASGEKLGREQAAGFCKENGEMGNRIGASSGDSLLVSRWLVCVSGGESGLARESKL